jgi:hypothetical protein
MDTANLSNISTREFLQMWCLASKNGFCRFCRNRQATGESFQSSSRTNTGRCTFCRHLQEANFHAGRFRATKNFAFVNTTSANSSPREDAEHASLPLPCSGCVFSENACVNIVANRGRAFKPLRKELLQSDVLPAQIWSLKDDAFLQIQRARYASPDSRDFFRSRFRFFQSNMDGFRKAFQCHLFTIVAASLSAFFCEDLEFVVEYDGHHLGPAKIKANPDSAAWGFVCHLFL